MRSSSAMVKGGCSGRLARIMTAQYVVMIMTISLIICAMRYQMIRGFVPNIMSQKVDWCAVRRCNILLLLSNSNRNSNNNIICDENRSVPTVMNPITKRRIHLGGPKYTELIKDGGWVQHEGTLQRVDMNMLARYQQDSSSSSRHQTTTIAPFEEHTNIEDKRYCITPVATEPSSNLKNTVANSEQSIVMDEKIIEKLARELLFVNKPSHLHCVPSRSLSDSLATQVLSSHPGSKPCHRLDRDTSGIVVFGLTKESHRNVSMQFEARTTSKSYVALIAGRPEQDHGIVNLPIGKQTTQDGFNRWTIGGAKPREAITHWVVDNAVTDTETGAVFTKVILKPVTGRGHQLRLHMKAIGCPILGDTIHSQGGIAMCSSRLCLHAHKLQVDWNGLRLEAESVPPF